MEIIVNGQARRVDPETTLATLVEQLGVQPSTIAVEVNRQLVPRVAHAEYQLREGDRLEVVTLVGGG